MGTRVERIDWSTFNPENPDWEAVREWSVNLARRFAKGGYQDPEWIQDLASAGFVRMYEIWQNHRDKPMVEWSAYMATVAVNAMKTIIANENAAHGVVPKEKVPEPEDVTYTLALQPISENERLAWWDSDGDVMAKGNREQWDSPQFLEAVEKRQAVEVIMDQAKRLLSPTQFHAFMGFTRYADLPGKEIAEKLQMTYESYRANKSYAIDILRNAMAGSF